MRGTKKKKRPERTERAEASAAIIAQRVQEILQIRLAGAEFWDVREYAREKMAAGEQPWKPKNGQKCLSDGQLWRYIGKADELIAQSCLSSRKKLIRNHTAQRRALYAKAVQAGDIRTALAVLADLARLTGLYPSEKHTHKLKGGVKMELVHEIVTEHPDLSLPDAIAERIAGPATNGKAHD